MIDTVISFPQTLDLDPTLDQPVAPEEVTSEMRRLAKAVNFGIPYGISPQGLAQGMGVAVAEARRYMEAYFQRFPGVRDYMEEVVAKAREVGYVTTLLGRRRPLPDLHARSRQVREFAQRTAIHTPIQGSAADIIKLAMLLCRSRLRAERLDAVMKPVIDLCNECHDVVAAALIAEGFHQHKRQWRKRRGC